MQRSITFPYIHLIKMQAKPIESILNTASPYFFLFSTSNHKPLPIWNEFF